jgi:hypothetical protein
LQSLTQDSGFAPDRTSDFAVRGAYVGSLRSFRQRDRQGFPGNGFPVPVPRGRVIRVETGENRILVGEDVVLRDEFSRLPGSDEGETESGFDEPDVVGQQEVIDRYNAAPQAALGGESPHDLVYGSGAGFVDTQHAESRDDDPPPKRIRFEDLSEVAQKQAPPPGDQVDAQQSSSVEFLPGRDAPVSRIERAELVRQFKKERKRARTLYRRQVDVMWENEIAEEKENQPSGVSYFPSEAEVMAEAFENYLFAKMEDFDREYAEKLATFRASLTVVPPRAGDDENPILRQARTRALWEGLRRVYFETHEEYKEGARARALQEGEQERTLLRLDDSSLDQDVAAALWKRVSHVDDVSSQTKGDHCRFLNPEIPMTIRPKEVHCRERQLDQDQQP